MTHSWFGAVAVKSRLDQVRVPRRGRVGPGGADPLGAPRRPRCPRRASAGRPGRGRCRGRPGGRPSRACGRRRPGSCPPTAARSAGPSTASRGRAGRGRPGLGGVVACSGPPAARCRWARPRDSARDDVVAVGVDERDYFLCWRSSSAPKKARRPLQDLVGPAQLRFSCSSSLHPRRLAVVTPGRVAVVDVGLPDPRPHRLDPVAELGRDPLDRPVLGAQLGAQRADHPHRRGLLLRAVPTRRRLPRRDCPSA